ncbi:uncharacterized protein LY89DRAFT_161104 [Mollisia scopiformis]|uniref:RRM domain-containing protein n=1 Tax=Mollisia scopiformis TaxID=149040 RepID=A0A194XRL5_MOLSC|nr:uncharacterized protein LY89DRAFT_161104 [Mollisia scopiformis]KUJ22930.1 hypothetical protein LY89DRAFT_161104 [Mollisia scopiformis]
MGTSGMENGSRAQTNGVLAVTASQTSGTSSRSAGVKSSNPKLKVIIRRLAPSLTETEFTTILGEQWRPGKGQIDWFLYKPGKDSKDPSKPSRPSRAYMHLTNEGYLHALYETVQEAVFEDAHTTFTSPCLIGPPSVEFAPYGRTPGGRRRIDARAGTIDQDPEFMAFLEGLANPTSTKEVSADALTDNTSGKQDKVTTTPLVQFLKDKKANKNKDAAVKLAKKQETQLKNKSSKDSPSSSVEDGKKKSKDVKVDKSLEKAAKEAVRILNREAAAKSGVSELTQSSEATTSQASTPPKLDVTKVPGRQRSAVVAAHIRMLQRDLGLTPAQAHRQVRRDTADAQKAERAAAAAEKAASETKESSASQPQAMASSSRPPSTQSRKVRGKAIATTEPQLNKSSTTSSAAPPAPVVLLRKPDTQQSSQVTLPSTHPPKPTPSVPASVARKSQTAVAVPSSGATQAFVKHANPSQGVTEALLKEAMEKYGGVSMVEIDKRKGFAYVDFVDTDGLKNAMAANPISVAQGTVQVMQRKGTALPPEKKPPHQAPQALSRGGSRGGRGGTIRRGGRGGLGGRGGGSAANTSETKAPSAAPTGPAVK